MIYKKYFVREDFEPKEGQWMLDIQDAIDQKVNSNPYQYDSIEHFLGNPACGPYVIVECDSLPAAEVAQHAILDVLYKFGVKRR